MFWKLQENVISDSDLDLLVSFIRQTTRFTQFAKVREFEAAFAAWQGCKYCVFVNSGSSANLILVNTLKQLRKWHDCDEVIVPAVTWPTTITPVMQCGLQPVFADTNLTDLSFDYDQIEAKITSRTRGIFVVHLLGFPANVNRLKEIVNGRDIEIIEDCCESQGATLNGVKVGNMGLAGTFSFYWGHHMTTVEGGMVCTNDEDLFKLLVLKRSHGLARDLPVEYHSALKAKYLDIDFDFLFLTDGFNVRNTEFNAVLGLAQLKRIDEFIRIRNRNYERFVAMCKCYPDELIVLESRGMSSFTLPFLFRRKDRKQAFQKLIQATGIESRPLISGNLLHQPFLRHYYEPNGYPNADFLHTNAFYVGNNQFVNDKRLDVLNELMAEFYAP
jgi:CDP-6-deoxy-D-xylo-4-hexulose-3-dehydrase